MSATSDSPFRQALQAAADARLPVVNEVEPEVSPYAVDPRTGEAHLLATSPITDLADFIVALKEGEHAYHEWRVMCEAEIARRLEAEGRRAAVIDGWSLRIDSGARREWDPDDLQLVVSDLVARGVVSAREVAGLTRTEVKVDGVMAKDLLGRLSGEPLRDLETCFTWKHGRQRVIVERDETATGKATNE